MKSIDEHIAKDENEILAAKAQGDEGKVRHLEGELQDLKVFKEHHPGDNHDPTSLEMFCENNPESLSAGFTTTDQRVISTPR